MRDVVSKISSKKFVMTKKYTNFAALLRGGARPEAVFGWRKDAKESAEAGRTEVRGGDSRPRRSPQRRRERRFKAETAAEVRGSQRGSREAKILNLKGIKETIIKVIQQCYNQREPNSGGNRRTG